MGEKQRLVLPTRMWHKFLKDVNNVYSLTEYLLHTKVQLGQWWVLLELLKGIWVRNYFQKLKWLKDYYIPVWETYHENWKFAQFQWLSEAFKLFTSQAYGVSLNDGIFHFSSQYSVFFFTCFSTIVFQQAFLCDGGL